MKGTLAGASRDLARTFGKLIVEIGKSIQPDYWVCTNCSNLEYYEKEVICWKCGIGEMIYKGDL